MEVNLSEIIAERKLTAIGFNQSHTAAKVVLGMPQILTESTFGDYVTAYKIVIGEIEKTHYMVGVDAIQSLQLALKAIRVELEAMERKYDIQLVWEGDSSGRFGFE